MTDKKKVAVFAGASAPSEFVSVAYDVGKLLAENNFVTITGGGPGLMREVNRGAFETGKESWGICLEFRLEQMDLHYFTYHEVHDRFDERNDRLLSLADAFVVLPGGLGTVVEALQITQREKFQEVPMDTPLIFIGEYHRPLHDRFVEMKQTGFIADDLNKLYEFVPSPTEMITELKKYFSKEQTVTVAIGQAHP